VLKITQKENVLPHSGHLLRFASDTDGEIISDTVVNIGRRFVDNLGACPASVFWAQGACTEGVACLHALF